MIKEPPLDYTGKNKDEGTEAPSPYIQWKKSNTGAFSKQERTGIKGLKYPVRTYVE